MAENTDLQKLEERIEGLQSTILNLMCNVRDYSYIQCEKLLDKIPLGLVFIDLDGRICSCNTQFETISGYCHSELKGQTFESLILPELVAKFNADFNSLLSVGIINDFEFALLKPTGKEVTISINGRADYDDKGKFLHIILIVKENIHQKVFTDKIRNSAERFKNQYFHNPIPTFTWQFFEDDFSIIDMNNTANKLINHVAGINLENASDFFTGNVELFVNLSNCFKDKSIFNKEVAFKTPFNKQLKILMLTFSFIEPDMIMMFAEDITEKRQTEENLRESEQHYQGLFNNMLDASAYFEILNNDEGVALNARVLDINKSFERILGTTRDQSIGKFVTDVFPGLTDSTMDWIKLFGECANNQKEFKFENYNDFYSKWFNFSVYSPKRSFFVLIFEDTTETKLSDEKLKNYHQKLSDAQSLAHIGSWEFHLKSERITWSEEVYEMLNHPYIKGIPDYPLMIELMGSESGKIFEEKNKNAIETGNSYSIDLKIKRENAFLYLNATTKVNYDKEGLPCSLTGTFFDITERILAEKELLRALEKAEESEKLKSSFLSNISHEIRTPMNAINGFSTLLIKNDLSQEKKSAYVNIIQSSSEALLKIIENIIDLSKLEANSLPLKSTKCSIDNLLGEIQNEFKVKLTNSRKQNIILKTSIPEIKIEEIYSDPMRIKQIFCNLIDNAIKFTDKGYIEFGYSVYKNLENKMSDTITFFVKDTGIGISKEKIKIIFEPFRQADDSDERPFGGNGIGLTISKRLIEMLGGSIGVNSTLGEGSTFYFTIPTSQVYSNFKQVNEMLN